MKKIVMTGLVLCLLSAVSGCVVVPRGPSYYGPAPVSVHVGVWR